MSSPRPRPAPRQSTPAQDIPPAADPVAPPAPPAGYPADPPAARPATPPESDEYTETVLVPTQIVLGVVVAVVAGAILLALGVWPLAIVAVLVVAGVSAYLGVQILTVTRTRVAIGQGRGDKSPHTIEASEIVAAEVQSVTWPQCFGIGVPDTVDTTRFTVRAGAVVALTKRDGELVRITARDPQAVLDRFGR